MKKRLFHEKELRLLRSLERAVNRWFEADDGSLEGLERDTKAVAQMTKWTHRLKALRHRFQSERKR